jgi:hypothetical protein
MQLAPMFTRVTPRRHALTAKATSMRDIPITMVIPGKNALTAKVTPMRNIPITVVIPVENALTAKATSVIKSTQTCPKDIQRSIDDDKGL